MSNKQSNNPEVISTSSRPFPATRPQRSSPVSVTFDDDDNVEPASTTVTKSAPKSPPQKAVPSKPVEVQKPSVETDPDFHSLSLPSNFIFYDFTSLSAGNVRGRHQAKFSAAAKNSSTRMVVETISSLLGDNISAAQLTIPDFYFVMYQLRLNCMGSVPLMVRTNCSNPDHVLAVADGKKDRKTLTSEMLVNKSTLKETYLEQSEVDEFLSRPEVLELKELGLELDAPRMADSIELEENWFDKPGYDEVEFLADLAGSIKGCPDIHPTPLTFNKRVDIVGNLSPKHIAVLRSWQSITQSYGVEETVTTTCKECGADIETEVSVSAHSFL